jgi:glycosyltransferase involved in cell wall biosynthesis
MAGRGALRYVVEYVVAHLQLFVRAAVALAAGADVVHLHNPPDTLFPVALLARTLGRRAVFDQHDLFPELLAERMGSARLVPLATAVQRAAARAASLVLVTNDSQRELVIARSGRERDSVVVVRNGPPRATLTAAPPGRGGVLGAPRLVYLGELAPQDGVSLLPALLLRPELASAQLTVVGDGPLRDELEREVAASSELAQRVRFIGYVDHDRVPELLAEADVAIDPAPATAFNDVSTMTKIAEYLAAALPVVAFDLRETRRTGGDAVVYAPDGDLDGFARAVADLAAEPARRDALRQAARRRAEELVWERSEDALLSAYALLQDLP